MLLGAILGCGQMTKPAPDWTKARKIAGREQKLSHVSAFVIDDRFAYATIGGNQADQNEGKSGLRRVALDTGEVTSLDDGSNLPQTDTGGVATDGKFIYWNGGGKILRVSRDGGAAETLASESVGTGSDIVVDNERVYWANHGYYSPNSPTRPSPVYVVSKQGGKPQIFADQQYVPHGLLLDDKFVYWVTPTSVLKQAKAGGQPQVLFQATDKEGVDVLEQDADNLYFGFRSAGNSRWAIRKISKNGGEAQIVAPTFSLSPFVVDEVNIYFLDEHSLMKDDICRVSKNGGDVKRLDTGYSTGVFGQTNSLIYFAGMDEVYSLPK